LDNILNQAKTDCSYKEGPLPQCAPLAVGFVPVQQDSNPQYRSEDALARGTLFPGLTCPGKTL
jgi:spore coat protein JB